MDEHTELQKQIDVIKRNVEMMENALHKTFQNVDEKLEHLKTVSENHNAIITRSLKYFIKSGE